MAAALVLAVPGPGAYQALAQTMPAARAIPSLAGPAVPMAPPGSAPASLRLEGLSPGLLPGSAGALPSSAAGAPIPAAPATRLGLDLAPVPDLARPGRAAAVPARHSALEASSPAPVGAGALAPPAAASALPVGAGGLPRPLPEAGFASRHARSVPSSGQEAAGGPGGRGGAPGTARAGAAAALARLGGAIGRAILSARPAPEAASEEAFHGRRHRPSLGGGAPQPAAAVGAAGGGGLRLSARGLAPAGGPAKPSPSAGPPVPAGGSPGPQDGSGGRGPRRFWTVAAELFRGEARLAPFLRPYRGRIRLAQAALIAQAVLNAALGYSVGALVDAALAHAVAAAAGWFGGMVALTVARILLVRFTWVLAEGVKVGLRQDFRAAFFARLQRTPESFAGRGDAAEAAMRLLHDVAKVPVKNVDIPIHAPQFALQVLLAAGLALATSWPLGLAALVGLPILAEASRRYARASERQQKGIAAMQAELTTRGQALLGGDRAARAAGDPEQAAAVYGASSRRYESSWLDVARLGADYGALRDFIQSASSDLLVLGAGLLSFMLTGAPSLGQVTSLRSYLSDLRVAFTGILDRYNESRAMDGALARLWELWDGADLPADKPGPAALEGSDTDSRGAR